MKSPKQIAIDELLRVAKSNRRIGDAPVMTLIEVVAELDNAGLLNGPNRKDRASVAAEEALRNAESEVAGGEPCPKCGQPLTMGGKCFNFDKCSTAEAKALIAERFVQASSVVTSRGRCHEAWTETWRRVDGADATEADVHAFQLLPRGQGHGVTAKGPVVTLHCTCDSGD